MFVIRKIGEYRILNKYKRDREIIFNMYWRMRESVLKYLRLVEN